MTFSNPDRFLESFGWTGALAASFAALGLENVRPARVVGQGRGHYHVQIAADDVREATITAKLRKAAVFPTVGDWVAVSPGAPLIIARVLDRQNLVQRRKVGGAREVQLIAANVDVVFVVTSANEDFDLPRIGRYLALAADANVRSVILLTKSDLCVNPAAYLDQLRGEFPGVEAFALSSGDAASLDRLAPFFAPGQTAVLLGSSGVGKSTLTNSLLGFEAQKTQGLSADARGKHTTTARYLKTTRWGGLVMDTPGMQDIVSLAPEPPPANEFEDLDELILQCKFTTCRHVNERGCAVLAEIERGALSAERWSAYRDRDLAPRRSKRR